MLQVPVIARGAEDASLLPSMANRHGLVAGATGTGKTFVRARLIAARAPSARRDRTRSSKATPALGKRTPAWVLCERVGKVTTW
jgi:MoxR-like ATPase